MGVIKKLMWTFGLMLLTLASVGAVKYDKWFTKAEMRVDLSHSGDANSEYYFVESYKMQKQWAGRLTYLVDTSGYGDNFFEVYDSLSNTLIYSKGYNNLFNEWQSSEEAKTNNRTFEEVIRFPCPKETVLIKMFRRLKNRQLKQLHQFYLNPKSYRVNRGEAYVFKTERLLGKKEIAKAVDIAILAEGYTHNQMDKFRADAKKMMEALFKVEPFDAVKEYFNVWLVYAESEESGTDVFGDSIFKNTVLNTHFYTFNSERYLTTQSITKVYDVASLVPCDQVYVLVNTDKYGGGAIYNYYNLTSIDHPASVRVFIHEFGHGFAGLADEYVDREVAFSDLFDLSQEPWQANISTLVNPDKKWKDMLDKGTPMPTPITDAYKNKVGFYEGGGYVAKGVYRPWQNCEMRQLYQGFCPVCQKAILQMLWWNVDK